MRVTAQVFGVVGVTCVLLGGCTSGRLTVAPPAAEPSTSPPITIARSRQDVWKSIVPKLSQTFFVINTIDQSSGLINVSYSGDPEQFVDCGKVTSYVKNARGERTYDFPAAKANQQYEVMTGSDLYNIDRSVALEGRANLVLEEISASSTRVSVNVRYVLSRTLRIRGVMGKETIDRTSISFSSGGKASFAANSDGQATSCQPGKRDDRAEWQENEKTRRQSVSMIVSTTEPPTSLFIRAIAVSSEDVTPIRSQLDHPPDLCR